MLFEDRKFADIGNTVNLQYTGGVYRITNCHPLPGIGIIEGLKLGASGCGGPFAARNQLLADYPRGLLLLAEMSSQGTLITEEYTRQTVEMAKQYPDYVIGFVSGRRLHPQFLHFSPGVQLESGKDSLGQQYRTPESVLIDCQSDVIIVGRGIYKAADPAAAAQQFQVRGWAAYQKRLGRQ
jgi:orotidine 5'-phosphate decarboxylase subfamily 1